MPRKPIIGIPTQEFYRVILPQHEVLETSTRWDKFRPDPDGQPKTCPTRKQGDNSWWPCTSPGSLLASRPGQGGPRPHNRRSVREKYI